jgi:hypothetical protein
MAMTVKELAARLNAEAARRGITGEQLLEQLSTEPATPRRKVGFVSLGASTSGRTAADADEMLDEGFGRS